jgi:hypothetical protein
LQECEGWNQKREIADIRITGWVQFLIFNYWQTALQKADFVV